MADQFFRSGVAGIDRVTFDAGLRAHMQRVFNYMGGGLALTGIVAFIVANTPLATIIFGSALRYIAMLAPLVFLMYMQVKINSVTAAASSNALLDFLRSHGSFHGSSVSGFHWSQRCARFLHYRCNLWRDEPFMVIRPSVT